jgi:hypothetical protein
MAMAVTKGVLKSVRMANLKLRIPALDEPRYCGVYQLERNARPRHGRAERLCNCYVPLNAETQDVHLSDGVSNLFR